MSSTDLILRSYVALLYLDFSRLDPGFEDLQPHKIPEKTTHINDAKKMILHILFNILIR